MGSQLFEGVKSAELLESPDQAALEVIAEKNQRATAASDNPYAP